MTEGYQPTIDMRAVQWQRGIGDAALGVVMGLTWLAYASGSMELMDLAAMALVVRAISHGLLNEDTARGINEVRVLAAADAAGAVVAVSDVLFHWGSHDEMLAWGVWRNVAVTLANGAWGLKVDKKLRDLGILE